MAIFGYATVNRTFRGGPIEIPGGGGIKILRHDFFFRISLQDFFMHLTSARIFFKTICTLLFACTIFFSLT